MEKVRIKKFIFFLLMAAMWAPLVNTLMRFHWDRPLHGAITHPQKPVFYARQWLEGKYQKEAEAYLNDTVAYHRALVRLHNQILYSAFNQGDSLRTVGPNGYLFETDYFQPHLGINYLGEDSIKKLVAQHRLVQDTLDKKGVKMLFVLCPSKARYLPEELPRHIPQVPPGPTNMDHFKQEFKAQGIQFVDMNSWFLEMKRRHPPYPLYSKTGIHWSSYGAYLVMDSLMKRMEQMVGKDMHEVRITHIETPDTLRPPDNDVAKTMNLIWVPAYERMGYPAYENVPIDSTKVRPDVLAIGDSYYWNLFGESITARYFGRNQFWFYNKWGYDGSRAYDVAEVLFQEEIEAQDFILFFYTEPQLSNYTTDFIQRAYRIYTDPAFAAKDIPITEEEIQDMIRNILQTPSWKASIEEKARKSNRPFDQQLRDDALFVLKDNKRKK
jgi:SGNH hydrolase-like domain, acetyltransferase AlgX